MRERLIDYIGFYAVSAIFQPHERERERERESERESHKSVPLMACVRLMIWFLFSVTSTLLV